MEEGEEEEEKDVRRRRKSGEEDEEKEVRSRRKSALKQILKAKVNSALVMATHIILTLPFIMLHLQCS